MSTVILSAQPRPSARPLATRVALAVLAFSANAALLGVLTFGGAADAEPAAIASAPAPVQKAPVQATEPVVQQKAAADEEILPPPPKPRPVPVRAKKLMPVRDFGGY